MFRPTRTGTNPASYYQQTPSPHTGETPLNRTQQSPSMPQSPGMEPLRPLGRSNAARTSSTGQTRQNRFQPSPSSPLSPGIEPPRPFDRSNAWRARFSTPVAGETPAGKAARQAIDTWLNKRPPLDSTSPLPLRGDNGQPLGQTGGRIYRYQPSPAHPHAARNEAIYTTVPVIFYRKGFSRHADIVLRRVNDVPGSTASQRRWHIERIEWKDSA